jgi:cobalt-zinc-cadmium efflux system outer membrane protein
MRAHNTILRKCIPATGAITLLLTGCASIPKTTERAQARPLGSHYEAMSEAAVTAPIAETNTVLTATVDTITIEQALTQALMKSPKLEALLHAILAAEARFDQAQRLQNPDLKIGMSEYDRDGSGLDMAEVEVELEQRIELGGKRARRARISRAQGSLASWDYETARLDVFTQTVTRFTDVIAAQRLLELAESAATLAEKTSSAVAERVKAGKEPALQATKARAELEMARLGRREAENRLEGSRKALAAMWGDGEPHFRQAAGDFDEVLHALPSLQAARRRLSANPALARRTAELELREAALAAAKAGRIPDLKASVGIQHFEEDGTESIAFGLVMPLPLFNRNQGNIAAAEHELAMLRAAQKATERALGVELATTHATLRQAQERVLALRTKVVPAMEEAFEAAHEGYREGKFGVLDMLDAQRGLFAARGALVSGLSDYHAAVAQLQRITGTDIQELVETKTEEK